MRLKDKVVVVTGGGSGFGAGIAQKCAEEGASVAILDVNEEGGKQTVDAIARSGCEGSAKFFRADVTRRSDIAAAIGATVDAHGKVDAYVNNAGITHPNRSVLEVEEAWFERIFAVNVKAIYL